MLLGPPYALEKELQFSSNVASALAILWLAFVIARNERADDSAFGNAMKREMSTILLAVGISGTYSIVTLVKELFL